MVELITQHKKVWSMFTLASLLDKTDQFRLHYFIHEDDWDDSLVKWILDNFNNVKVYQAFWKEECISRMVLHVKETYKDKGGLAKRMVVWHGNRIFLKDVDSGQLPPPEFFKDSLSYIGREKIFDNHPHFKNYYNILKLPTTTHQGLPYISKDMCILNYDKLAEFHNADLFFTNNRMPPAKQDEHYLDTQLIAANNFAFFENLTVYQHGWMPIYVNGRLDELHGKEAFGVKDCLDYNVLLRKAYSLDFTHKTLVHPYLDLPTGIQLTVPWDCYTRLIDNIPLKFRDARVNEILLEKERKQKQMAGKLLERGFYLGKV